MSGDGDGDGFVYLDGGAVGSALQLSDLIPHLSSSLPALRSAIVSPARHHLPLENLPGSPSLLLMPSWSSHPSIPYIAVKIVTSFPFNSSLSLPGVQATLLLFSSATGAPLAALDGTLITLLRTAAVSALASLRLSRPDSSVLAIIGAGALAPYLVRAHRFVRPAIDRVLIWNRTPEKARDLAARLAAEEEESGVRFEQVDLVGEAVAAADVVCCATRSEIAVVEGSMLKGGAHLNLVGSFTPEMRECDEEAIRRAGIVVVDFEAAMEEAGELVGALESGVLSRGDVVTLADLLAGAEEARRPMAGCCDGGGVTVFKSVGGAVADLLAGQLAYQKHLGKGKLSSPAPPAC